MKTMPFPVDLSRVNHGVYLSFRTHELYCSWVGSWNASRRGQQVQWQDGYDEGRRMGTKTALAERDQLKTENEALRKDAERYRWLRDSSESIHQFYLSTPIWFTGVKFSKQNVDSTIDASMSKGVVE